MGIPKYNANRDRNEPEIVNFLKERGCLVWRLSRPVDLLIHHPDGHTYLAEVKTPEGKLNQLQQQFLREWPNVAILRSKDDAMLWVDNDKVRKPS